MTSKGRSHIAGLHALMERYVDGDRRAFEQLYRSLEPRLRGFLMKLIRDEPTVDDVLQLTVLKAHLARERFQLRGGDPDGAVQGWYFAIARNVAMDHLRDKYRRDRRRDGSGVTDDGVDPVMELPDGVPTIEQVGLREEEQQRIVGRVREAIALLPDGQREVVELHKLRGMTMAEVARRLEVREGAVRVRAHRAYKALARILVSRTPEAT